YVGNTGSGNVTQVVGQRQDAAEQTEMKKNSLYPESLDNIYKCPVCGKSFGQLSRALDHQMSHSTDRAFHCSPCVRSFKYKKDFNRHVRETHANQVDYLPLKTPSKHVRESEERGNPCPECDKNFARWDTLQLHLKSVHATGERHACPECGKLLSHKRQLPRHIREVHTRDYHKRCEQCGKMFSRASVLKKHTGLVHVTLFPDAGPHRISEKWINLPNSLQPSRRNRGGTSRCYKCGMPGHWRNQWPRTRPLVHNKILEYSSFPGWVAISALTQATIQAVIEIDGKRELCLIATGAGVSLRQRGNQAERRPCALAVRAVGGYRMQIDGLSMHSIRLGDKSVQHTFLISSDIEQTILGADFLKSTDSVIDLKQGKLVTSYGAVKLEGYPSTAEVICMSESFRLVTYQPWNIKCLSQPIVIFHVYACVRDLSVLAFCPLSLSAYPDFSRSASEVPLFTLNRELQFSTSNVHLGPADNFFEELIDLPPILGLQRLIATAQSTEIKVAAFSGSGRHRVSEKTISFTPGGSPVPIGQARIEPMSTQPEQNNCIKPIFKGMRGKCIKIRLTVCLQKHQVNKSKNQKNRVSMDALADNAHLPAGRIARRCFGVLNGLFEGYVPFSYASSTGSGDVTQDVGQLQGSSEQTEMTKNSFYPKRLDNIYKCPVCDKSYAQLSRALDHQTSHSTDHAFHCSPCMRSFKHKKNLNRHVRKTHANQVDYLPLKTTSKQVRESEERGNPCPECDKNFSRWDTLQLHLKSVHTTGERHACPECGKLLNHKRQLLRHIREVHMRDYHKRCEQCGKMFSRASVLKKHTGLVHALDYCILFASVASKFDRIQCVTSLLIDDESPIVAGFLSPRFLRFITVCVSRIHYQFDKNSPYALRTTVLIYLQSAFYYDFSQFVDSRFSPGLLHVGIPGIVEKTRNNFEASAHSRISTAQKPDHHE
ncbi:zinc finger and SCAN domain-containing protein 12, partial [Clonorchis sinensis]